MDTPHQPLHYRMSIVWTCSRCEARAPIAQSGIYEGVAIEAWPPDGWTYAVSSSKPVAFVCSACTPLLLRELEAEFDAAREVPPGDSNG